MHTIYHLLEMKDITSDQMLAAVSSAEGFRGWWTTGTRKRDDGTFEFHFSENYHKEFRQDNCDEMSARYTCTKGHPEWVGTTIDLQIERTEGGGLNLHFRHRGWKDQSPMFGICNYHWALYMKSLEGFLKTGTGSPSTYDLK